MVPPPNPGAPRRRGKAKKKKPVKGIKKSLPRRPPRPTTAYNAFVREFVRQNGQDPRAFHRAADAWRGMDAAAKKVYADRNEAERTSRVEAVKKWKKLEKARKRPPSGYSLYVKDLWKREKETLDRMDFPTAARHTSASWIALPTKDKENWEKLHDDLMREYRRQTVKVANGQKLDENWMKLTKKRPQGQVHFEPEPAPGNNLAQAEGVVQDEEMQDAVDGDQAVGGDLVADADVADGGDDAVDHEIEE